jgi:hypothetical protein
MAKTTYTPHWASIAAHVMAQCLLVFQPMMATSRALLTAEMKTHNDDSETVGGRGMQISDPLL